MVIKNWKKEIRTIPNLLSLFRVLLIPVYMRIYLGASKLSDYFLAGGILAVSCLTDLMDGFIARRYAMISNVGKLLDPLADKLTQLALIVCLASDHPVLYPVLMLFVVKETFQVTAVVTHLHRGKALPGALDAGKICTAILFLSLITLVLFPQIPEFFVEILAVSDTIFLLFAFCQYILAYYGTNKKIQDIENQ